MASASTASGSTSSIAESISTSPQPEELEVRPQAGPLPQKRGEIGFRESLHGAQEQALEAEADALPARHPADRDHPPTSPAPSSRGAPPAPPTADVSPPSSSDTNSMRKSRKHKFFSFIVRSKLAKAKLGGVSILTIFRLIFQLSLIGGTLAAWIIITKRLNKNGGGPFSGLNDPNDPPTISGSSSIFVHVTFGIAMLGQLLFLERCIFFIRAQRYAHKHPGSVLPSHGRSGPRGNMPGMGFAPWNRPPLPTYAAALAQSGVGTGDVEDSAIAIPPPPAYGNTRGSTLLLTGFLRNSLRDVIAREDRARVGEHGGQDQRPMSQNSRIDRPVSYRSRDEEWEERCDAERALRLAETLERLEDGSNTTTRSPNALVAERT